MVGRRAGVAGVKRPGVEVVYPVGVVGPLDVMG